MKRFAHILAMAGLMLAATFSASAAPVDAQKALRAAQNYMNLNGGEGISLVDITSTTPFSEFYVFAGSDGKGFVLVSGDDCVLPILGFSATSQFATKNMPPQIKEWLEDCEAQIRFYKADLKIGGLEESNGRPQLTTRSSQLTTLAWERLLSGQQPQQPYNTSVSPLVSTTWGQDPLYNNMCPYDYSEGEYTATGCVATATAQVMKYWNHPTTGHGSHSYLSDYGNLSANFGTTTYAWSSMPTILTSSSSTTQINAVAKLMYHLGVALEMGYDVPANGGSGAVTYYGNDPTDPTAENILKRYFKYKPSLHHIVMADYTSTQWSNMLVNELNHSRPIIYAGRDASGGHCFVCDGYNNSGLFHFNWGWNGYCDGYYAIGNLHPAAGGTGGNVTYTFNLSNAAVIGIEPNNSFGGTTSVTASPNNAAYGSVSGGGTYSGTNTNTVTLTATASSGNRFTQWSDGYKYNERNFLANGGTYSFTANFEPLTGDTLGYCSGDALTSYGSSGSTTTWGIKIPASALTNGSTLSKVQLYIAAAGSYTVNIYSGTSSPTTTELTQNFSATSSNVGYWGTLTLNTPVAINGTQSLWIAFSSSASYPAAVTYYSGNNDSRLWGSSLSPNTSMGYSFMVRGIFDNNSVPPTPPTTGDTLSYCGNAAYDEAVGAGGSLTWGIKVPAAYLAGRTSISDVLIYIPENGAGTYQMNLYQGTTTSTTNRIAQMSNSFGTSAEGSWQTYHLPSPVNISSTSPLWVTFSNSGTTYPAATCLYTGDSNSSLLTLDGSTWMSLYTASEGSINGSWLIKVVSGGGSTPSLGDTVSYCGSQGFSTSIGTQSALQWGIRLPHYMYSHGDQLSSVMLYIPENGAGTYTLNIYCGSTTSSSTLLRTMSHTYTTSQEISWQTLTLASPIDISNLSQPIWITFSTSNIDYPAASCTYTGDTNSCLVYYNNAWQSLLRINSDLAYSWMIRAILSGEEQDCTVSTFPYSMGFESTDNTSCLTLVDSDGDGYGWGVPPFTGVSRTGSSCYASASFINDVGVLTPNNWLILPQMNLTAGHGYTLTWYDGAVDSNYYDEHYAVYVSTTGSSTSNFLTTSPVFQTTLTTHNYTMHTVNLSAYAGQNINIAFRHYNSTDVYWLLLDDISVTETAPQSYTINVLSANTSMGNVSGGGTYPQGSTVTISATAYSGYHFTQWNDGNTQNPRTITVTGNATYTAYFAQNETQSYTINVVSANQNMGTTTGSGTYTAGSTITIAAVPYTGYYFTQWSDGNTQNPRTITVTGDATYVANFAPNQPQGIEDVHCSLAIASLPGNIISISGVENRTVEIYDITGRRLSNTLCTENVFQAVMPASGVYLVVVDKLPARKVVLLR